MPPRGSVKVLYIVGFPRSGSTLLERLLGEQAGLFSAGEMGRIWERGFLGNELCSCGQPFRSCSFWTSVVDQAFGGPGGVNVEAMAATIDGLGCRRTRWNEISRRLLSSDGSPPSALDEVLLALYRAILTVSGAPALVDSSKDSAYALMLAKTAGIDVDVVHLVRDSRAVAYSWQRRRRRPEIVGRDEFMPLVRPAGSATGWSVRNSSAEVLRWFSQRYVRLRYEDLTTDPDRELARILNWKKPTGKDVHRPTVGDQPNRYHTVSGNPLRFKKGPLEVTQDVEWMSAMNSRDRAVVTALTFPLLLRYGYSLTPAQAPRMAARR